MRVPKKKDRILLSGNEALARGAYEAGVRVACAYPGTPSTEILETLSGFPEVDAQWSVNEKVAFEVALSSAIGGVRSLYASKHVGLNVAMDPLMTASYTGINAGFVVVVCDDPGLHSSQNEQDTRWVSIYAKLPLLEPSGAREAYEFVKEAFKISERFDTPVLLRMTTRVAHSKEDLSFSQREAPPKRPFVVDIPKYVMVPSNAYRRHILVEKRIERLRKFSERTRLNRIEHHGKRLGIVTSGISYLYAKELCPDASFLKLGFVYPFCDDKIVEFAKSVGRLVVIEELDPFIENHLRSLGIRFRTKHPAFGVGELRPEDVSLILEGKTRSRKIPLVKKPMMCSGCPHRFVFAVLKKLKVVVAGDIGCYTLGATPPLLSLHSCVCMGAGVTFNEGLRRALPKRKIVGVVGDSTFVHSGITGLINAAYNGMKGVIVILDNATTAMTGGQDHPATGRTIKKVKTKKLILEDICKSCGADIVDVIDPHDVVKMEDLFRKRLGQDRLSVIIVRSPCVLLARKTRPAPVFLEETCRKCSLCFKIDCPALEKTDEGYVEIDPDVCTGCDLCVEVCPFGALVRHEH